MMNFLVTHALESSLAAAGLGLLAAFGLIAWIRSRSDGNDRMREVAAAIQEGAAAYLNRQLQAVSLIAFALFVAIVWLKNLPTGLGFIVGAACSLAAGFFGMRIAVMANVRTAEAASQGRTAALRTAFNGGAVTGLLVVGLALLSIGAFYMIALKWVGLRAAIDSLTGLALGSSLVSVFARLGGGIYTKAADVGADLVGKIESKLEEDDPRNPATIADNVGDNVGDCAGMAADVFETYAVSLIGCVLVAFLTVIGANGQPDPHALVYPFIIGGVSILSAILGILTVNYGKGNPTKLISLGVLVSALASAAALWPLTHAFFPNGLPIDGRICSANGIYFASLVGLLMTFVVLLITNYYTSTHYRPVQHIAKASETGHATNIIAGLAIGSHATALPVGFIGIAILLSYHFAGLFGIAIAVMAMLSMAGIIISLDAFGPITDNAGGIAVMSGLPKQVRERTDELDAVGNTMKAVTKGYAIASAGLASLVLFGTYVQELKAHFLAMHIAMPSLEFSLVEPKVIIGLFIGGLLPFVFTARSMDAVGVAAGAVVREVRRQIAAKPGILTHKDKPDYGTCVDIVTKAALRQMIVPALLPVIFVVGVAAIPGLGPVVLGGVLVGTIVTGLFVAIAMTSSGGAWDNAKKFIEEGNFGGKGSPAHAAAVTGDTVGDPYKDTAGPAINPMIKVVNIVAILVIPIFF
ncbi:MAG: sodium-translocating pyrophosphatase [Candidatus Methylacidiphilales bacterium]|jgi:K(+)-stimulated pyrophosphate-energized sodium pump